MFAIAFDLTVAETKLRHPKGVAQAYFDIGAALQEFGFRGIQGSVYVCDSEDMANLFQAIGALKALPLVSGIRSRCARFPHRAVVGFYRYHEGRAIRAPSAF